MLFYVEMRHKLTPHGEWLRNRTPYHSREAATAAANASRDLNRNYRYRVVEDDRITLPEGYRVGPDHLRRAVQAVVIAIHTREDGTPIYLAEWTDAKTGETRLTYIR